MTAFLTMLAVYLSGVVLTYLWARKFVFGPDFDLDGLDGGWMLVICGGWFFMLPIIGIGLLFTRER